MSSPRSNQTSITRNRDSCLKHPLCLTSNTTARLPGADGMASRQPEALNSAQ